MAGIIKQGDQCVIGTFGAGSCQRKGLSVLLQPLRGVPVPLLNMVGGPLWALLVVALVAGIRRTQADTQVWPRNADTVIAPRVDFHVGGGRHMAVNARAANGSAMEMVFGRLVLVGLMTLQAHAVTRQTQFQRMGVVAVAAGHAGLIHLALQEGAVHKDFVLNLSIRVVKPLIQRRQQVVFDQQAGILAIIK